MTGIPIRKRFGQDFGQHELRCNRTNVPVFNRPKQIFCGLGPLMRFLKGIDENI